MIADVILLPKDLTPADVAGRTVVVFDVLRFTTTLTTALAAGAAAVYLFPDLDAAQKACAAFPGQKLLCGERDALRPKGFDLGNSPADFTTARVTGKTLFFCTTNGTRAVLAAESAQLAGQPPAPLLASALVNASAAARAVANLANDVTLLCSGTQDQVSDEDVLGAGALIAALQKLDTVDLASDRAKDAQSAFAAAKDHLPRLLRQTPAGQNIHRANLDPDIDFAARKDVFTVVPKLNRAPTLHFVQTKH